MGCELRLLAGGGGGGGRGRRKCTCVSACMHACVSAGESQACKWSLA